MSENITENEYIELSNQFKELYEKIKDENQELKKLIMVCYSLFRIQDLGLEEVSEIGRSITSDYIEKNLLNV